MTTDSDDPRTLVSTAWLAAHLNDPDLRVIDATWFLEPGRDARAEYEAAHIPGARFFDLDAIADGRSGLPHMAPQPEMFVSRMRAMGIGDGHQVVVYDNSPVHSAARVWWTFRLMGKQDVAVLDGGLAKWLAEGRETEDMPPVLRDRHITVQRQAGLVRDVTQVAAASSDPPTQPSARRCGCTKELATTSPPATVRWIAVAVAGSAAARHAAGAATSAVTQAEASTSIRGSASASRPTANSTG